MIGQVIENSICEYCSEEFTPKRKGQRFCKPTCRVYSSQVRTGRKIQYMTAEKIAGLSEAPKLTQNELKKKVDTMRAEIDIKIEIHTNIFEYRDYPEEMQHEPNNVKDEYSKKLIEEINYLNRSITETLYKIAPGLTENVLTKPSEISKKKKYDVTIDFRKFRDVGLYGATDVTGLGLLPYPFIIYFNSDNKEMNEYDREIFYSYFPNLVHNFSRHLNAKALFVAHKTGDYDALLKKLDSKNLDNVFFIEVENRAEIEKTIKNNSVDILFVLDADYYPIDYAFLKNLQQINNKLCIIVSSENAIQTIAKGASLTMNINDKKIQDYNYNGIFCIKNKKGSEIPLFFDTY